MANTVENADYSRSISYVITIRGPVTQIEDMVRTDEETRRGLEDDIFRLLCQLYGERDFNVVIEGR